MKSVFICDSVRTAIGKYGGSLASVRTDDLAAIPLTALMERNPNVDWQVVDDVLLGCANQAGEDNRNVARMATLLSGLPFSVSGSTINRLCGSGMDAVGTAARSIMAGEADLCIAGGVESMSRAPFVMGKSESAFGRTSQLEDTTMGWRFVNPKLDKMFGTHSMPITAENLAEKFAISRKDQDKFAFASQTKAAAAQADGRLGEEIIPVSIAQRKADPIIFDKDEHLRLTPVEKLSKLRVLFKEDGTVTAGNASGINDGAAAMIVASEDAVKKYNLTPKARVLGMAQAGVEPRVMGIGPVFATQKLIHRIGMSLDQMDILEFNEAFSAQALACTRELGLADDDPRINPQGGAIALGHPLGVSGARIVQSAATQLSRDSGSKFALCTMCIGVGQGIAMALERV